MRRSTPFVLAAIVLGVGVLAYVVIGRTPTPGPLQPTGNINSFGINVDDGSTISFVVEFRGEQALTATLQSISLANPDPGLNLVGTGIVAGSFLGYTLPSFPPGDLTPVAGTQVTTVPSGPSADVFLVLGIHSDLRTGSQSVRGVWLDYDVGGTHYRALLPWLLTLCPNPSTQVCQGQDGRQFQMPAPDN